MKRAVRAERRISRRRCKVIGVVTLLAIGLQLAVVRRSAAEASPSAAPVVATQEKPLCGAHCLYVALRSLDFPVESLEHLQETLGSAPPGGYSLGKLEESAQAFSAQTLGVETTLERLAHRPGRFACIAHLKQNHFVNIVDVTPDSVIYFDSPGFQTMPRLTFSAIWGGKALLISPQPLIAEADIVVGSAEQGWNWWWAAPAMAVMAGGVWFAWSRRQ